MTQAIKPTLKTVLVFKDGELIRQIPYPTKKSAKQNYNHFKKRGILDPHTGQPIPNTHFELL